MSNINFEHKDLTLTRDLIRKLNQLEGGGSGGVLVLEGNLSGSNPYTASINWQTDGVSGYASVKDAYDDGNIVFIVLHIPEGVVETQKDIVLKLSFFSSNETFKFVSDNFICDFVDITDIDKAGKPCFATISMRQNESLTVVNFGLSYPNEIIKFNGTINNPSAASSSISIQAGYADMEALMGAGKTVGLSMVFGNETLHFPFSCWDSNGDIVFSNYALVSNNFRIVDIHFVEENADYAEIKNYQLSDQNSTEDIEVTYAALMALINDEDLIPNQTYRITDFATTCDSSSVDTDVTGLTMVLQVKAADTYRIFPEAKVVDCDETVFGDNYQHWKIMYDVNNDTFLYDWADTVNGKGVIYYMEDEFGNCCDYDFKNILFFNSVENIYFYTFNYSDNILGVNKDATSPVTGARCNNNIIKSNRDTNNRLILAPINIIINNDDSEDDKVVSDNVFECCSSLEMAGPVESNNIKNCTDCHFGNSVRNILYNLNNVTVSVGFSDNIMRGASNTTIGTGFSNNTVASNFKATVGNGVKFNTFGESFYNNTVGNYYRNCVFGNGITGATFASSGSEIKYVHVASGFSGTFNGALYDNINNPSIFVSRTSTGIVKTYSIADLVK